jgi:hypothetical protein
MSYDVTPNFFLAFCSLAGGDKVNVDINKATLSSISNVHRATDVRRISAKQ